MPIFSLPEDQLIFPDPRLASDQGILAIGGDLSPDRLLLAYRHGIFPWFNPGEPILWWSPDPRFVLFPEDLKVSRSMRPYFNQGKFEVSLDAAFGQVMAYCRDVPRKRQRGMSWITPEMLEGYEALYELGYAHSVEVWDSDRLVGGLYGISLGRIFFGESMFSLEPNASKFGFIWLVRRLQSEGFSMIDCQTPSRHLTSLGARNIGREDFLERLAQNHSFPDLRGNWGTLLK